MANLKQLYDTLKEDGAPLPDSYDKFVDYMTSGPNNGYDHRKQVYDSLKEDGAPLPDTYEEFSKSLFSAKYPKSGSASVAGNSVSSEKGGLDGRGAMLAPQNGNAPGEELLRYARSAKQQTWLGGETGAPKDKRSDEAEAATRDQGSTEVAAREPETDVEVRDPGSWNSPFQRSMKMRSIGNGVNQTISGINTATENTRRVQESFTQQGRDRRKAGEFQARVAGLPSKVYGMKSPAPNAEGNESPEGGELNTLSPFASGVKMENGELKTEWQLPDGSLTTDFTKADEAEYVARQGRLQNEFVKRMKQNGLDPSNQADVDAQIKKDMLDVAEKNVEQRLDKNQRSIRDIQDKRSERFDESNKWDDNEGFWENVARILGGSVRRGVENEHPVNRTPGSLTNEDRDLRTLTSENLILEKARDLLETRKLKKSYGFMGGFWNIGNNLINMEMAAKDVLTNPDFYADGIISLQNECQLLSLDEKLRSGQSLSDAEVGLLYSNMLASAIEQNTDLPHGYKAAQTTIEMVPFMAQMMLNPASGLSKALVKKFGKSGLKKLALTVAGDVAESAVLVNTLQAPAMAADAVNRYRGDAVTDENGKVVFDGSHNWASAIGKAEGSLLIENFTEKLGDHFGAIKGFTGKLLGKGIEKLGGGKILESASEFITKINTTDWAKAISNLESRANWNGVLDEVLEEEAGIVLNSLFIGDNKISDLVDADQQIDIVLGVGLFGGFVSGLKTIGYPIERAKVKSSLKKRDSIGGWRFGEDWDAMKAEIESAEDSDLNIVIKDLINEHAKSKEQARAIVEYAQALMKARGCDLAVACASADGNMSPEEKDIEECFDHGASIAEEHNAEAMNDARMRYERELKRVQSSWSEDEISMFDADPIDALSRIADPELKRTVVDYINAKQVYEGMIQRVRDDIDEQIALSDAMIDSRVNRKTGKIQSATVNDGESEGGKQGYIVDGTVSMFEDGSGVDAQNSSESVIVRYSDGTVGFVNPLQISNIGEDIDAEAEKELAREQIRQRIAQEASNNIDGVLSFAQGDVYPVLDADGNQREVEVLGQSVDQDGMPVDWSVDVQFPDGSIQSVAKSDLQEWVNAANESRVAQFEAERDEYFATPGDKQAPEDKQRGAAEATTRDQGATKVVAPEPVDGRGASLAQRNGNVSTGAPGDKQASGMEERGASLAQQNGNADAYPQGSLSSEISQGEVDENGRPFVVSSDGSTTFGQITADSGLSPAPIKLSEGFQDVTTGKGYGLLHMEANHGKQIRQAGFKSVQDFVSFVSQNYDIDNIRVGKRREDGSGTFLLQVTDKHENTLFIELSKDGSYWSVNSGGVFRKGYSYKKETVAKTEPQQPNNAVSGDPSLSADEQSGISSTEPNGESTASNDKDNTLLSDKQGIEDESSPLGRIPRDEEGEPMFELSESPEVGWDALVEYSDGDVSAAQVVADTMVEEKRKELEKARKLKPKGKTPKEILASSQENSAQLARAEAEYNMWQSIAGVEQARQDAIRVQQEEEQRQRAEQEEAEAIAKKQEEQEWKEKKKSLDKRVRETAEMVKDCPEALEVLEDMEPHDIYEVAAQTLAYSKVLLNDKNGAVGAKRELGLGKGEQKAYFGLFASAEKGGKSLKRLAEDMKEDCEIYGVPYDNGEALNALLDIMQSHSTRGEIMSYIANNRISQAKRIYEHFENMMRSEEERMSQEMYHMSAEEARTYQEVMAQEAEKHLKYFDEQEYYNTFAEEFYQREKEYDTRSEEGRGRSNGSGNVEVKQNDSSGEGGILGRGNEVLSAEESNLPAGDQGNERSGIPSLNGSESSDPKSPLSSGSSRGEVEGNFAPGDKQITPGDKQITPGDKQASGVDGRGASLAQRNGNDDTGLNKADSLGERIAEAEAVVNTSPSEKQKEAGNYKKGHVQVGTFDVTIENPKGSTRSGVDADGTPWETTMTHTYGYIRGTEGVDGDHIDVYISSDIDNWGNTSFPSDQNQESDYEGEPSLRSDRNVDERQVFVVDQYNPDGSFDEHKVMLGFNSKDEAFDAYLSNYEAGWENGRRLDVTAVSLADFEKWVESSKRKTKPFAEYKMVAEATDRNTEDSSVHGRDVESEEDPRFQIGETSDLRLLHGKEDNQGNPIDNDGRLIVEDIKAVAEITDEDFTNPTRNVGLPILPHNVSEAIGAQGRNVVIKKRIFEKNRDTHKELTPSESREILERSLYNPNLVGSSQPIRRPDYRVAIQTGDKNAVAVLDVYSGKENVEIVGWRKVDDKGLEKMKRQAEREGGQFLILSPTEGSAAALSALPHGVSSDGKDNNLSLDSEWRLTETPKTLEGPDLVPTSDKLSSEGKDNTLLSAKQEGSGKSSETPKDKQKIDRAKVYDVAKGLVESAGIEVVEVSDEEANAMMGNKNTPVIDQSNRANEKLISGSVLLSAKGDSSSNANVPSEANTKIKQNTQSAKNNIKKYKNGDAKIDLSSLNTAFKSISALFRMRNKGGSRYTILQTDGGSKIAVRLSDHRANGNNFRQDNADKNLSIVIERRKFDTIDSEIEFTEVVISENTFNEHSQEVVAAIVKGLEDVLSDGEFTIDKALGTVEKFGSEKLRFLKDGVGKVYGWTVGGKVYLNKDAMNPETPLHEDTHLWDEMVRKENPELWERGKELMKQLPLWDDIKNDPAYSNIRDNEDEIASEVHSRLVGSEGARLMEDYIEEAKSRGAMATAEAVTLVDRLKNWLAEMFDSLKKTLGKWSGKDLRNLTVEDFTRMTLRDLAEGMNPNEEVRRGKTAREVVEANPMLDDYHRGVRSREDVMTFDEVLAEAEKAWDEYGDLTYPDMDINMLRDAKESGRITIYSSKPIETGVFVTPSRMNAADYAGGGKVYSKKVGVNEVAWTGEDEGQYAPSAEVGETSIRFSLIGEKGAKRLDDATNSFYRIQGLEVAKSMDLDNIDALNIDSRAGAGYRSAMDSGISFEPNSEYGESGDVAAVNEKFNEDLKKFERGELDEKFRFELGMPSKYLLSAGFPDLPISMRQALLKKKSQQPNHPFDVSDVRNIVIAIQKPLALFKYSKDNVRNLIISLERDGKHFLVGVTLGFRRDGLEINSISGLFPKQNHEWIKWIQDGLAVRIDQKEKVLKLIDSLRINPAEAKRIGLDLDNTANIVKNFENPQISEETNRESEYNTDEDLLYRQGEGGYSDAEMSQESDPWSLAWGESFRSKKQKQKFAERERKRMRARLEELTEQLGIEVDLIEDVEVAKVRGLNERKQNAKGWYDISTGKITLILGNHRNTEDLEATILHEAVAHKGLRKMFGEKFDAFLDAVYDHAENGIKEQIDLLATKNGWNRRVATEEYLAGLAERTNFEDTMASWWRKIKSLFMDFLRNCGFSGNITLTDNELRYVLWMSWRNLQEPGLYKSFLGEAERVAKEYELGVGEFAEAQSLNKNSLPPEDKQSTGVDIAAEAGMLNEANERFNEQLQEWTNGKLPASSYVSVGYPHGVMSQFMPNNEIILRQNVLSKARKKHNLSEKEMRNLPYALANPIFVFKSSPETVSVLTELKSSAGKNIFVAIEVGISKQLGHRTLNVNDILTVHGRENENIILPIIENNSLVWVDKEKGFDWLSSAKSNSQAIAKQTLGKDAMLSSASSSYQQEIAGHNLESVAKIVESFVNPTIGEQNNNAEEGVLFRDGDFTPHDRVLVSDIYEDMVSQGSYQFQEAIQDSMLGLKKLYEAVLTEGDKRKQRDFRIEEVAGYENAYLYENRMSSTNQSEQHEYFIKYLKPLLSSIHKLCGDNAEDRRILTDYMMAKHGLERNEYMRKAAADRNSKLKPGQKPENLNRDFAGLCGLTGEKDWRKAEAAAQKMVDDFENIYDKALIDEIWSNTRNATQATIEKLYTSGVISEQTYNDVLGMYDYYIPLRGWDETTSDEVYGYLTNDKSPLVHGSVFKKASGRRSKADDPLATIAMMADDAIRQGNRNIMKQRFLNFVQGNPSDLVSVNELWLQYDDVRDKWVPVFADLEPDMSPAEVEAEISKFEAKMESLKVAEPNKYRKGRDAKNIPFIINKNNLREHQVLVKRNGRTYVMTINGNPRAAQALNGLTNPDVKTEGVVGDLLAAGEYINRNLSAFYTTRNPDFGVSNFMRDMLYSNCMTWVKENPRYALRFHRNFTMFNPAKLHGLLVKWENGSLGMNDKYEKMFKDFMLNGGETGYTSIKDIEGHKKTITKELKKQGNTSRKVWYALGKELELLNRSVENCARFAAFVTSREMGRSIDRSIYDAKEVSVNFNKKGSGSKFLHANGQTWWGNTGARLGGAARLLYVFWNAGVQGMTNFGRAAKRHPGKALAGASSLFSLGVVIPLLAQAMGSGDGDDDDKNAYYNLPEYVRRSNVCFKTGDQWVAIPLPIEYRSIYGLGELACGVITGNERYSDSELAMALAGQVSQIMPLDVLEGGGGISPFIPSGIKPFTEAYIMNKSWTGMPVYKDTPFNKNDPEWTKAYQSSEQHLVQFTKWLNETSGGNDYLKGKIDINPAKLEYLLNGTFGGMVSFPLKAYKTGEWAVGNREFEWRNTPLANRLVKSGDERTEFRKLQNEYYKYKEEAEWTKSLLKKYENAKDQGILGYAERADFLYNSEENLRCEIFEQFRPGIKDIEDNIKAETNPDKKKKLERMRFGIMRELVDALHDPKMYLKKIGVK